MDHHFYSLHTARSIFCVNDSKFEKSFLPESRSFGGKGYLHAFLASRRLMAMKNQGEGTHFMSTFTISLDTQFPSYLRSRAQGKKISGQDEALTECLRFLAPYRNGTDITPYLHENQDRLDSDPVRETVTAFLEFRTADHDRLRDTGEIRSALSGSQLNAEITGLFEMLGGADWQVMTQRAKVNWAVSYMVLLFAAVIHLRHQNEKPVDRLVRLLEHLDEIGFLPKIEIHFVHKFFELGNRGHFFRHIQRSGKDVIKRLANMAWDLSHKRTIIEGVTNVARVDQDHADFVVPYMLTFDQALRDLLNGYQLKGLISYMDNGVRFLEIYPEEVEERLSEAFHQWPHLFEPGRKGDRLLRGRQFFSSEARRDELILHAESLLRSTLQETLYTFPNA